VQRAVVRDETGEPQGIVSAIVDVTEDRRLRRELQDLAISDPLTGTANRREFMRRALIEIRRARRGRNPLSVIAIDLDRFKSINDGYGHQAGDQVLATVAARLRTGLRDSIDILARFGGEEFIVLLPDTGAREADALAWRLRDAVRQPPIQWNGHALDVTASFGVAPVSAVGPPESALSKALAEADQALYRAKETGRDRVHSAG
jgi:diguanylate cyclase (GGDEF)-like protein